MSSTLALARLASGGGGGAQLPSRGTKPMPTGTGISGPLAIVLEEGEQQVVLAPGP